MLERNQEETKKILICAMGGEGGGVLMNWIVNAAWSKGFIVQATSVPGVAQRTGATTYYIEILPQVLPQGAPRPIFALNPTPGEVDLLIATEAAEAARAANNGYITPDRTHLIASTSRAYLMPEKMAMTDGRINSEKLTKILQKSSLSCSLFDANHAAKECGAIVNAVMLGAIAAADVIGITLEEFIDAIRSEGKAVDSNISGINAGFAIGSGVVLDSDNRVIIDTDNEKNPGSSTKANLKELFPESAHVIIEHGINRLLDYQNKLYAETYLTRLEMFKEVDPSLLFAVAKQLALRMAYEDIIRVAQAKVRPGRFIRIRKEAKSSSADIVAVTDFFKPGITEVADMLPIWLGKKLLEWGRKRGKLDHFGFSMKVKTTTIFGFLKVWFLSKLRFWRPRTFRWSVEQHNINSWLSMVHRLSTIDVDFAIEVAELARLIKGYGSTHRRGAKNYRRIIDELVEPCLVTGKVSAHDLKKIRLARDAATNNPDGSDLDKAIIAA